MSEATWTLEDAQHRLADLVEAAGRGMPQVVTSDGVRAAVVVSVDQYDRLVASAGPPRHNFRDHLLDMPRGGEDFERVDANVRPLADS